MKKKILLVGKKSFIGSNLYFILSKVFFVKTIDFKTLLNKKKIIFQNYDIVINCSINNKYIKNKYLSKNDFDLKIANKIKNFNCKMIFLSSRKVYKPADNINETSKILPRCNYSKNKLITEKKLLTLLGNKLLILRISNLIGYNYSFPNYRKIHFTFIDHFLKNIKKGFIFENKNIYKDFLPINKFCEIVIKLIKIGAFGIYNVSIGKKIFLKDLVKWLNFNNPNKINYVKLPININKDCFYLDNSKLLNVIKIQIDVDDLRKYCKRLSRKIFTI